MQTTEFAKSSSKMSIDEVNDPPRWVIGTVVVPYTSQFAAKQLESQMEKVRAEHMRGIES
jgi:hypothetical protein